MPQPKLPPERAHEYEIDELAEIQSLALRLATEAGELLSEGLLTARVRIDTKSSDVDMVSEMDKASEAMIVKAIREHRPHDGLLGEEGASLPGTSGYEWVIDPLDGTTNYLYQQPQWSVSIGVTLHGVPVVAAIDAPMLGETYTAVTARGATLLRHGRDPLALSVSGCTDFSLALVGTGFSYSRERRGVQGPYSAVLLPIVRDLRRLGSAALDLAFVAAGRLDAYYEAALNPWDACAGTLLVREAGGVVTGLEGDEPDFTMTIAGSPAIHPQLHDHMRANYR